MSRGVQLLSSLVMFMAVTGSLWAGGARELSGHRGAVPSLARLYRNYFPVGAAVDPTTLVSQGALLEAQVNSLVAENAMKWERIHPLEGNAPNDYQFAAADEIAQFAREHHMLLRGHTLVWHQQTPEWVFRARGSSSAPASTALLLERMQEHISTVLHHFHGEVYAWDVVNEAISDSGGWRTDSPWYRIAGKAGSDGVPEYIEKAFEDARRADPTAKLFYNDYGIESGAKLDRALELVKALKAKGLIDGVGIQGHWQIQSVSPEQIRYAIDQFAALGVKVQITELDLSVYRWGDESSLPSLPPDRAKLQAKVYGELFKVFREEARAGHLTGVTFWGIADDHTWLDNFPVPGRKNWPLLFDAKHRPKEAFWAVAEW